MADKLLRRGNKALRNELIVERAPETKSQSKRVITEEMENMLLNYEHCAMNKELLEVVFPTVSDDGEYTLIDDGIIFKSTLADLVKYNNMKPDLSRRADYINKPLNVIVQSVDSENGIVYLAAEKEGLSNEEMMIVRRKMATREILEHFNKAEEKGEPFRLPVSARVFKVRNNEVLMNVLDYNILARIPITSWSKGYVRNLKDVVKVGEVYEINLIGRRIIKSTKIIEWRAEHYSFTSDPWSRINTDIVKVGTTLSIDCVEVDEARKEWWGVPADNSIIPQRLEVKGVIESNARIKPVVGQRYQCRIQKVKISDNGKNAIIVKVFRPDTSNSVGGIKKIERSKK